MKDRSKKLTVVNTDKRKPVTGPSANENVGGGGTGLSFGDMSIGGGLDYLLKAVWDKVWEIKTDSQGNEYIFGKLPVVTQYGITMYADGGNLDLPSIYAGLPIDGSTLIRDDNGVLMINPDIDLGGGLTEVYWNDIKSKPTFATVATSGKYSDLSGLPDLSVYATTEYLTAELKKYVTLNTEQNIGAHKNFLNGLSVGGLGITKSQDDVVYIDANLVVRGGITMYATDTVDVPSIIDSLPTASTSAKGLASFDPNFFSVDDNGNVSFIGSTGGVDESVLADYAKKTDLSAYLSLNGGQMTGNIGYTLSPDSYGVGIPASGSVAYSTSWTEVASNSKTFIGSIVDNNTGFWYNMISVRHQNGNPNTDGAKYGMYIYSDMTHTAYRNLVWNQQFDGAWQGERVILDSVNWKDYVSVGNGGISGNVLTVDGSNYRGGYPALRMHIPNVTYVQFLMTESGMVELRYGDSGQSGGLQNLSIYTLYTENGLHFGGGEVFDYHGNIYIPNADGSWSWNVFNSNSSNVMSVYTNGNVLVAGGITMYSDIRKKTKLQDVELTLQQISDAPLIKHYYNSDAMRTTHVGSTAQYWASMNDWFCKLDSEGFYTMEIQNAALASAISIARELVKYESKTDKEIRLLKQMVKELEDKIGNLENN